MAHWNIVPLSVCECACLDGYIIFEDFEYWSFPTHRSPFVCAMFEANYTYLVTTLEAQLYTSIHKTGKLHHYHQPLVSHD